MITNTKLSSNFLKLLLCAVFCTTLTSCEIFATIETDKPMVIDRIISENRYRLNYTFNNSVYFMEIITEENYKVGDTLRLVK